jgi:hypothetical protein
MSHFAVMVIMPKGTTMDDFDTKLEKIMAPYQENNMGDCPREFMEFDDQEDAWRKEYEEDKTEKIVCEDGTLANSWDERFRRKPTEEELKKNPFSGFSGINEPPAHLERRQVPFTELYATFEEYVAGYHGQEKRDDTYNRYGYWNNPNCKWDWWEVGGRWSGYFTLKGNKTGLKGRQYNHDRSLRPSRRPDVCYMRDIDWETMRRQSEESAAKQYDAVHKAINGLPKVTSWEEIRTQYQDMKATMEAARDHYWSQPAAKAFRGLPYEVTGLFDSVERFQVPKEEFLQRARRGAGVSFAVVKDGKWYEKGEMGWWGMASNEKDDDTWNSMFSKMIDELPEDTLLTVVDCHI